ncbi:MAG TPA: MBL fold metallo-hydrolase [Acidimicrobiales bacterium]|jgi:glyoxylase-like metal-dependent hydrolase (beta-lactamase superfamily II)/ferredoxin
MARLDLRNLGNADGEWFVDTRCIDCGTCREIAPDLFTYSGDCSVVARQPRSDEELDAWLAAQACPTSSIGTISHRARPGRLYPREVRPDSGVFDLGYCSEDSYGASSWFVRRPSGNVLVDSPRYTEALAGPLADMGGIDHVVLTHRDDVADAERWATRFGARVWIHADDRRAAPFATDLVEGTDDVTITPGLVAVPTPGHTKGSMVFVLEDRWLFSGDSLAWSQERQDLTAFRDVCWWSWPDQLDSLARLADRHRFDAVLPGHGARVVGDAEDLHGRLLGLVDRARSGVSNGRRPAASIP